jgi:hypothetical protein
MPDARYFEYGEITGATRRKYDCHLSSVFCPLNYRTDPARDASGGESVHPERRVFPAGIQVQPG